MTFLKKLEWQDWILIITLLFFTISYTLIFSNFNQFPSEYYGGDHYAHFSSVLKIYNSYNPFISPHYINELQHYPWLTPFLIAVFAKITFLNPMTAATFFPVLIIFFTIIITYVFGKKYFNSKSFALILSLTWAVQLIPSFHPSEFAKQLMVPLIALLILLIYPIKNDELTAKRKIFAGIIYGLAGLQHMVTFFISSIIIITVLILNIVENKLALQTVKQQIKKLVPVIIIGWLIACLFWAPILVKYQGDTLNDWQAYTAESLYPSADFVTEAFLDVMGYQEGILSLVVFLFLFVVILIFGVKKADKKIFVPLLLFFAALIGIIHPYITLPFFNMTLGYYRFPIVFVFVKHLILILGIYYIWTEIIKKILQKKEKLLTIIAFTLILIWITASFMFLIADFKNSERYQYAVEDNVKIKAYQNMYEFLKNNDLINKDLVTVTTHPDMGFFFNAMTSMPVMATRITHGSAFVDHNKRTADMAVLLYGDNKTKTDELLEKYNVGYFFLETGNIEFRKYCLDNWDETKKSGKNDKTTKAYWCIQTDPVYEDYIESYGVETASAYVRLAAGDKDVPLKKILAVKPGIMSLNIEKIYEYVDEEGNVILELYTIN
ncbi:hypothetical protein COV16_00760 [Candidatus Woesearchaeota archaeon CG10_big_fil_rev_8_21_14_0_10_34_8]|nr:MAG: hypothetical protein COV16_00760 [Candidatus Woesearchaeota archaeon CG10_big_fil_rev_8_21_14_0_10_34_8]